MLLSQPTVAAPESMSSVSRVGESLLDSHYITPVAENLSTQQLLSLGP